MAVERERRDKHTPRALSDKLCMNKREGRPCKAGLKCPFGHEGMSGKICTDAQYLVKGLCAMFIDCKDKHPYDEPKHGDKATLMSQYGHKQAAERAYFHAVNVVEEAPADAGWEAGQGTLPLEWVNQLISEGFEREAVLNVLYIGMDISTARIMLTGDGLDWSDDPDSTSSGYSSGDPRLDRKGPPKLCSCPGIFPAGRGTKSTHGCAVELDNPPELETGVCHDCATGDCSKGTGC